MKKFIPYLPYVVLIQSLLGMLGSLFFSNILNIPPCVLCWYQRITLYPLVIIAIVAILRKDKQLPYYVLPFSIIGLLTSIYHNLLAYHVLPESIAPCTAGVSCVQQEFIVGGFITIPLLSFVAFAIITASMILYITSMRRETASKHK